MPEGHSLFRLAGSLQEAFGGTRPRASSPQGRFAEGAARLDGRLLEQAESRGKHLFLCFEQDIVLGVHLGLIGRFDVSARADLADVPPPVGAVRLRLVNDTHLADLRGATRVELVTPEEVEATVGRLGPDPLRAGTPGNEPERALLRLNRSRRTVAECLMDQSVLAGVGNVYRSEVLFRHRVDPFRPGREIRPGTFRAIWDDLVALLPLGVAFGQILTMEHQVQDALELMAAAPAESGAPAPAGPPPFPREYYVYRRAGEPCHVCGSRIRTQVLAGRNLFWCGRCQRRR